MPKLKSTYLQGFSEEKQLNKWAGVKKVDKFFSIWNEECKEKLIYVGNDDLVLNNTKNLCLSKWFTGFV